MEGRTEGARVGIVLVAGVEGGLAALAVHYALKKLHLYMQKPRELKVRAKVTVERDARAGASAIHSFIHSFIRWRFH